MDHTTLRGKFDRIVIADKIRESLDKKFKPFPEFKEEIVAAALKDIRAIDAEGNVDPNSTNDGWMSQDTFVSMVVLPYNYSVDARVSDMTIRLRAQYHTLKRVVWYALVSGLITGALITIVINMVFARYCTIT